MFVCAVCGCKESKVGSVDEVFNVDGDYVLVEKVPATVCIRCGEHSFSLGTAEAVSEAVRNGATPVKSIEMRVYKFASENLSSHGKQPISEPTLD